MANVQRRVLVAHPGAELYGSDRVMLASVQAFVADGDEVLVALPHAGPLVAEIRRRGAAVAFTTMPVLRKAVLRPRGLIRFAADVARGWWSGQRMLRSFRPDVVYTSTLTIPLWIALGRVAQVPVVSHVHEAEASAPLFVRRVLAAPQLAATAVVANSRATAEVLGDSFEKLGRRAEIVINAIPGPDDITPARATLASPVRLLYVGRLSERKGVDVALDAASLLSARKVELQLQLLGGVFTGYEWFEVRLRERISTLGLGHRVRFLGFQPDVWQHIADSDIVLVPSIGDESFGNAVVEAVLCGRPAVVSDIAGLREAADAYRSVELVKPGDAYAIAEAVERIMDEWPARRKQAVEDSQSAARRHAEDVYAERIREVVRRIGCGRSAQDQTC